MARIVLELDNWTEKLINCINNSQDGDTIVVDNESKAELGRRALARMHPEKQLTFEVEANRA